MQGELFKMSGPVADVDALKISKAPEGWMDRFRMTLRLDHLSIGAILALVLYVLVFSFGVEKGKRFALQEIEAERTKRERITQEISALAAPEIPVFPPTASPSSSLSVAAPSTPASPELKSVEVSGPLTGHYTIQMITFAHRSRADLEVKRLKEKGFRAFVWPAGRFFQICIEAFNDMSEAREKLTRLKDEGFAPPDAYIRPLKGQVTI